MSSSDKPSTGPGSQDTWSASRACTAWWIECAVIATPVGHLVTPSPETIVVTATTPGIASTSAALCTVPTWPPSVGGRFTTVGRAPGTSRSIV